MQKKIVVVGLGVSGRASAAFLLKRGYSVLALDKEEAKLRSDKRVQALLELGLELFSDQQELAWEEIFQMILSPGIDPSHPTVFKARKRKVEVIGEIELAFRHLKNRCIGITGTNGKTTTTLLITHVLNQGGVRARALGNVGSSLSGYLMESDPEEVLIVELSSFQLETLQARALDAALILNISPNHLDRHLSMEAYIAAKLQIQRALKESGELFVSTQVAQMCSTALREFKIFDRPDVATIPRIEYTRWEGPGDQNVKAAYAICSFLDVSSSLFYESMRTFRKPSHRIEWVAEIDEIAYYNDSKATNVEAVIHAVKQFEAPLLLLVGGVDKGASYHPWIEAFLGKVKKIVAFGKAAKKIEEELQGFFSLERVETLKEALLLARRSAEPKDAILLSPGCSSYDQFANYEARGEEFKQMVRELEWTERKPF